MERSMAKTPAPEVTQPGPSARRPAIGQAVRLRHAVVSEAGTLPAGLNGQIRSLHRNHARLACQFEGRTRVLKVPLDSLSF